MTTKTESGSTHRVVEMEGELADARGRLTVAKRESARLLRKVDAESRALLRWTTLATSAMRAGDDVVARDALARKRVCEDTARGLRKELASKADDLAGLGAALSAASFRLEQIRATLAVAERSQLRAPAPSQPTS